MGAAVNGRLVYFATQSDYGRRGGAIVVLEQRGPIPLCRRGNAYQLWDVAARNLVDQGKLPFDERASMRVTLGNYLLRCQEKCFVR